MMRLNHAPLLLLLSIVISIGCPATAWAQNKPANPAGAAAGDNGWPRKFAIGGSSFALYQPQIEEWVGNRFAARAATSITEGQGRQPSYGVLWFGARAEIDKVNRMVTLSDFKVTNLSFPTAADKVPAYASALQARVNNKDEVIALDRLLADLAQSNHTGWFSLRSEERSTADFLQHQARAAHPD